MGKIKHTWNWITKKLDELYADPAVRAEQDKARLAETPEFQETERKKRLETLVTAVKTGVSKGNSNLSDCLKQLCDVAQEGDLPDGFARKNIYESGKKRIERIYSNEVFPSMNNIRLVADDAAQLHKDILGEELDTEAYLHEIHGHLLELAQQYLELSLNDIDALVNEAERDGLFADAQLKAGIDNVKQEYMQAELLLERAGLSEEEAAKAGRKINALFAQAVLSYLKIPAKYADVGDFESHANALARALDATGAQPAQRAVVMRDVALKRLDCYHNLFNMLVDLFAEGQTPVSALEDAVAMNNQVVEQVASALEQCAVDEGKYGSAEQAKIAGLRMQYTQHVKPNSYRVEIRRLLGGLNNQDNGHPRATKRRIVNIIRKVNALMPKAGLDEDEFYELRGMIKTIKSDSGYWSSQIPEQSWRRNGRHNYQDKGQYLDRRMQRFTKKHR